MQSKITNIRLNCALALGECPKDSGGHKSTCSAGHRACKELLLLVILASPKAHDPAMPIELDNIAGGHLKEVICSYKRIRGELKDCG